jgi:hypothetical protein
MDILVRQDFTREDIKQARLDGMEFRKGKKTSGASNVLNMTDLKKSVILCDTHQRKFGKGKHGYKLAHEHSRVIGRCDVCQAWGNGWLYLSEELWLSQFKAAERFKRALEYATIVS